MTTTILGIAAAAAASSAANGGAVLQAGEARRQPGRHVLRVSLLLRLARRPRWLAGTLLTALCMPLQAGALLLAPITVVQPALALGLVLLLPLTARFLGESIRPRELTCVVAIVAGVAVAAASAGHRAATAHLGPAGIASLVALAALIALPFARRTAARRQGEALAAAAGLAYGLAAILANLFGHAASHGHVAAAIGWAAAVAAAAVAATTSEMSALQQRPANRVIPLVLGAETVVPVVLAPIVAGQAWGSTPASAFALAGGVALVVAGSAALARSPSADQVLNAAVAGEPSGAN